MNDEPKPNKSELIPSRTSSLVRKKSGLIKRGLELTHELKRRQARIFLCDDQDSIDKSQPLKEPEAETGFLFYCWKCGIQLQVDSSKGGQIIECPKCGAELKTPALVDSETTDIPRVVLIAEDDGMTCEILADFIKKGFKGVPIVTVSDGDEALQYINRHPPLLLILNMVMPRKGGAEVLRELSDRSERFPILVTSGWFKSKEHVAAEAEIASDRFEFLNKPFTGEVLVGIMQKMLSQQDL